MNKLRKFSLKRAFAGTTAFTIFALAVASVFSTITALRPQTVEAQSQATFEWLNVGTIKVGTVLYSDQNPWDQNHEFLPSTVSRCSYQQINNRPSDSVVVDSENAGYKVNINSATRKTLTDKRDISGQLVCEEVSTRLTASSTSAANMTMYRQGDTLKPYISGAASFVKTATVDIDGSTGIEVFVRDSELNAPCKDIIVHGTNGAYNGWFAFPMSPNADPGGIRSERYNSFFPGSESCWGAPFEIETAWKLAPPYSQCSGDPNCPPVEYPVSWGGYWEASFGDDAYRMVTPPGTVANAPDPNAPGVDQGETVKTTCDQSFSFVNFVSLKWLVCPFVDLILQTIQFLEDFLVGQLTIDTAAFQSSSGFHAVWAGMRTISLAIIVIVAMVIVIFQAAGIEAFGARTVKTMLTSSGAAVLLIVVSFPAAGELANIINIITDGARNLVYGPLTNGLGGTKLESGSSIMLILLGTGAVIALGPWGLLSFVLTAVLSIGLTVVIITAAKSIFLLAAIFLPIGIAAKTTELTKPLGDFIIGALKSAAAGLAAVGIVLPLLDAIAEVIAAQGGTINNLVALIIKVVRVAVVAAIFMRIGGFLATATGAFNDRTRGAFDRLKNVRSNQMSKRHQGRMDGTDKVFGSTGLANAYQRVADVGNGGLSMTRRGRARYGEHKRARLANKTEEMLKRDNGRFSGDDDANALALEKGMTEGRFINEYMRRTGTNAQTAREVLAGIENSYGAKLGTGAMRVAAFRARSSSKTSYDSGQKGLNQAYGEAASLVSEGLMTQADAAAALKHNKERADFSGVGFSETFAQVGRSTAKYRNGARGSSRPGDEIVTQAEAERLQDDALQGATPGQLIGGYHKGVSSLAPAMARRLQNTIRDANGDWSKIMPQFAAYNARKELMGQVSEKSAQILAQEAGAQQITVPKADGSMATMTIDQFSDAMRDPKFAMAEFGVDATAYQRMKREYGTGMADDYNRRQAAAAQGMGGPGSGPGGIPGL